MPCGPRSFADLSYSMCFPNTESVSAFKVTPLILLSASSFSRILFETRIGRTLQLLLLPFPEVWSLMYLP